MCRRVCFDFPKFVEVSAFSNSRVLFDFSLVIFVCSEKVSFGSKVTPSILGFFGVGMVWLFIVSVSVVLYSAGSGVNRVACDFSGLSCRSFSFVQVYIWFR